MRTYVVRMLFLITIGLSAPTFSRADEQADSLLHKVREATASLPTLQGDLRITTSTSRRKPLTFTASVTLKKPNLARVEFAPPVGMLWVSDGQTLYRYSELEREYREYPVDPAGRSLWVIRAEPVTLFFGPYLDLFGRDSPAPSRYLGEEKIEGETYRIVELRDPKEFEAFAVKFYIDDRFLITRIVKERKLDGGGVYRAEFVLSHLRTGADVEAKTFEFRPPATAKRLVQNESEDTLLDVGTKAPDFRLLKPGGGEISLLETLKGKKAVLVNFWFLACEPCREEFPRLQKLHEEWTGRGLAVIAINSGGRAKEVETYLSSNRFTFPVALGRDTEAGGGTPVFTAYGVGAWPTNYLIDGAGVVRWRGVGFDEAAIRKALDELGFR